METLRSPTLALSAGAAVAFGLALALSAPAAALHPQPPELAVDAPPRLPAEILRSFTLGFRVIAADALYLQAIQAYGAQKSPDDAHRRAVDVLLESATDLDPDFCFAYRFGGLAVTKNSAQGWRGAPEAALLLEKGTRHCPGEWQVPFLLAYVESWMLGDEARAAGHMAEAARRPDAPAYLAPLATRLAAHAGSIDDGLAFTNELLRQTEDENQRADLEERLRLLRMERGARVLEAAARRYKELRGDYPRRASELLRAGLLAQIPSDEHNGNWRFDPATGEVSSTAARRLRLPPEVVREIEANRKRAEAATGAAPPQPTATPTPTPGKEKP